MNHRVFACCVFLFDYQSTVSFITIGLNGLTKHRRRLLIDSPVNSNSNLHAIDTPNRVFEKRFSIDSSRLFHEIWHTFKVPDLIRRHKLWIQIEQHKLLFAARQHQQPRYYQLKVYTHFLVQRLSLSFIETRNSRYKIAIYLRSWKSFNAFMLSCIKRRLYEGIIAAWRSRFKTATVQHELWSNTTYGSISRLLRTIISINIFLNLSWILNIFI